MHCGSLRCTAVHCNALRCTAVHCSALRCTAVHWCTAVHCSALPSFLLNKIQKNGNDEVAVLLCRVCTVHDRIKRPLYPNKQLAPWPHGNDADECRKTGFCFVISASLPWGQGVSILFWSSGRFILSCTAQSAFLFSPLDKISTSKNLKQKGKKRENEEKEKENQVEKRSRKVKENKRKERRLRAAVLAGASTALPFCATWPPAQWARWAKSARYCAPGRPSGSSGPSGPATARQVRSAPCPHSPRHSTSHAHAGSAQRTAQCTAVHCSTAAQWRALQ